MKGTDALRDFMIRVLKLNFKNYLELLTNMGNDTDVAALLDSVLKAKNDSKPCNILLCI